MSICVMCTKSITKNSPGIACSGTCGSSFHANSTCCEMSKIQLTTLKELTGARWSCSTCRKCPSQHQMSRTRSNDAGDGTATDIVIAAAADGSMKDLLDALTKNIESLRDSVEFCSNKITDFEQKLSNIHKLSKNIDSLQFENTALKEKVSRMEKKLDNIEKFNRSYNIELQDIPETPNENLMDIANKVAIMLNFNLNTAMIDNIFRVPSQVENKAKNIIIKFLSKLERDRFLSAANVARKGLQGKSGFNIGGVSNKFFINEHISPQTKLLFKEVREKAKTNNIKFVWVQNGNVLVRRSENTKIIAISRTDDLNTV